MQGKEGINLRFRDQKDDRNQHNPRPDQKDIKGPAPGDVIVDKPSDNGPETYAGVRNAPGCVKTVRTWTNEGACSINHHRCLQAFAREHVSNRPASN